MNTLSTGATCRTDRTSNAAMNEAATEAPTQLSALSVRKLCHLADYKYPVLFLPNEVVSQIFIALVPVYPAVFYMTGEHSPIKLLAICRLWRAIALHTPELWRSLFCNLGFFKTSERMNWYISQAEAWLGRARAMPLAIKCQFGYGPSLFMEQEETLLNTVFARRGQWERMDIRFRRSQMTDIYKCLCGPTLRLRHLSLMCLSSATGNWHPASTSLLIQAPELHSVSLTNVPFNVDPLFLPWHQLTDIELVRVELASCIPVLQQAKRLVRCRLVLASPALEHSPGIGSIPLPNLDTFILLAGAGYDDEETNGCISLFTLPTLRRMQISLPFAAAFLGEIAHGNNALMQTIRRSGCSATLERVRLTPVLGHPGDELQTRIRGLLAATTNKSVLVDFNQVYQDCSEGRWKSEDYWEVLDEE